MQTRKLMMALCATAAAAGYSAPALAQANPYLGQMMLVPYTFCPAGWQTASGQMLPISENSGLFSLIGTNFGGDGVTTFALPDMRGRTPIGVGRGPYLSGYAIGESGGAENEKLSVLEMPTHTHTATATSLIKVASGQVADTSKPGGNAFAQTGTTNVYYTGAPTNNFMDVDNVQTTVTLAPAGGGQPFSIVQPFLAMQWCIAISGLYPPRP